ncbi:MAG: TMEM175 family protein [Sphingomonas sp.]
MTHDYTPAGPEHQLERLIFFSDAVFAIAITLLVIELRAPDLPFAASIHDHLLALSQLIPGFIGFIISFFVIGAFWAGHHRTLALAESWDERLILPNLTMLFAIAAMPFFTAYLSANPGTRLPALLYCGWLLVAALFNVRLQRIVCAPPIVDPKAPAVRVAHVKRRGVAVALGALTAILAVALLPLPGFGLIALATIPLWRRLLDRQAHRASRQAE